MKDNGNVENMFRKNKWRCDYFEKYFLHFF